MRFWLSLLIVTANPAAPAPAAPPVLVLRAPQSASLKQGNPRSVTPIAHQQTDTRETPAKAPPDEAASASRPPEAIEVFYCSFEDASDADLDNWPDHWTRRRGPAYPRYLPITIVEEPTAPDGRHALRIGMNGGTAEVLSPSFEVGSLFSYVLEGSIRTADLQRDRAYLSISFYDAAGELLETFDTEQLTTAAEWTQVRLGPLAPHSDKARSAVIALHVEPTGAADIKGTVWFDDIRLSRLPRMTLTMNRPHCVYTTADEIEVACKVSGLFEHDPTMNFEIVDATSQTVALDQPRLAEKVVAHRSSQASALMGDAVTKVDGFAGTTTWKPQLTQPGFYRLRVTMHGKSGLILDRQISLVVVEPQPRPRSGEFGWTLPAGDQPLSFAALLELLPQAGINWVKFPVWTSEQQAGRLDQLVNFAERLSSQRIESVGVLCDPPPDIRSQIGEAAHLTAADIFSTEIQLWYPLLEPVMTRLALQIRWWQLGQDDDFSFVGYPALSSRVREVKHQLQRFGQEVHVGMAWSVLNEVPPEKQPAWEFLTLSANPPLTQHELAEYLPSMRNEHSQRWVSVQPLERGEYSTSVRASDLIYRMLAAKMHGAEGIFVSDPISTARGLMNDDGTPGELLLPWRTTALALSGAEYLGSLRLEHGSQNHVFVRDGQAVMVVWNDRSLEEKLYLGEDVRQTDIWGRRSVPPRIQHQQVIKVGPVPSFVTGVSEPIARWNMAIQFEKTQLPSVFGLPQQNSYTLKNFFPQGVGGKVRLITPDSWKTYPRVYDFKLAAGEEVQQPLSITLPFDASSGRQNIRIDFEINADRRYEFSVYRHLDVGLGDVTLEVRTRLADDGDLIVEQFVDNQSADQVSFKCLLFAVDRPRLVSQVVRLGKDRDAKVYRFPNGRELIGKTLMLRAEEIGGSRTLNHRFVATE